MNQYKLKKGYDLPIKGEAEKSILGSTEPTHLYVHPTRFPGIKPRMLVKKGASVKRGTPIFQDKKHPERVFVSPGSGVIEDIVLGQRRALDKVCIKLSGDEVEQYRAYKKEEIAGIDRDELIQHLMKGGLWPQIRQRPFSRVAHPETKPSSIFVNCMDTAPLAADAEFNLQGRTIEFQAGIEALKVLCPTVHVVVAAGNNSSDFLKVQGVQQHSFSGKHPAGLVSTHIHRIDPIKHGKHVWYLNARDVADIGDFLLVGQYPSETVVAVAGPGLGKPGYVKTRKGAPASAIASLANPEANVRLISGNVLNGKACASDDGLGLYDDLITVIPEGGEQKFLGWLVPGFKRPTYGRAYMSGFLPARPTRMDTSLNGEERAFVKTGDYERVMGLDILPDYLIKSILIEDVERMEKLGILEVDPEDFALCAYICPSKIEFTEIVARGLDIMEVEMI
ncbi:MAG: Na(+)-translocating NADH-quinone reductase subunit A [Leptospiraceae bacterium]|nr:Na(+)-translocating NADH-quinone reductase subunit A [Leptospiraceae bacterium]MCB1303602.1 Na(+)-translocating NADH-quinone reductase subunit A [Leptospiraceae bacterium]